MPLLFNKTPCVPLFTRGKDQGKDRDRYVWFQSEIQPVADGDDFSNILFNLSYSSVDI